MLASEVRQCLPEVPVHTLSNVLVQKLIDKKIIRVENFERSRLGPTSYKLYAGKIRYISVDGDYISHENTIILNMRNTYTLKPGEHVVISPMEKFVLSPGLYVTFFPASFCIENRLLLTMGRLDADYQGEIVFGAYNSSPDPVEISSGFDLARASIGWTGPQNLPDYEGNVEHASHIAEKERQRKMHEIEKEIERLQGKIKDLGSE